MHSEEFHLQRREEEESCPVELCCSKRNQTFSADASEPRASELGVVLCKTGSFFVKHMQRRRKFRFVLNIDRLVCLSML